MIGPEMDDRYMEVLKKLAIHPEIMREEGKDQFFDKRKTPGYEDPGEGFIIED